MAYRIGRYIAQYPNGKKNKILIGRDTRLSGTMLDSALIAGITSGGGDVYELGVTTTPSISYLVERHNFDFGVMISASHNPFYDNGIKVFAPNGEKLSNDIELEIERYMDSPIDYLPLLANNKIGRLIIAKKLTTDYLEYLASKAEGDMSHIRLAIDCAHGSAAVTAHELFVKKLHLNADIFNDSFDGIDINDNCGSTHLKFLREKVVEGHYDLGIAFDGDADRCLFVDSDGQIIDGDATMFMNAMHLKKNHHLNNDTLVITVMSNFGLKKVLKEKGLKYEEVSVGDKYVQSCLREKHLSLGGEQSGHIIFNDDLNTGDGQLTAIHLLNILASTKKSIKELLKDFVVFPQTLVNIPVSNKDAIMEHQGVLKYIKEQEKTLNGDGRILVRSSGTEPLIRVMVEAVDLNICQEISNKICSYIKDLNY